MRLESPAKASIPSVDNTQRSNNTPAICRNGDDKIPIAQEITRRIKISQRVIGCPLMLKRTISGIGKPLM